MKTLIDIEKYLQNREVFISINFIDKNSKPIINEFTTIKIGAVQVEEIEENEEYYLGFDFSDFRGEGEGIKYYSYGSIDKLIGFVKKNFTPIRLMREAYLVRLGISRKAPSIVGATFLNL